MFGNKDSVTTEQLTEALEPLLKRLDELEKSVKRLKMVNKSLQDKVSALSNNKNENNANDALAGLYAHSNNPASDGDVAPTNAKQEPEVKKSKVVFLPSPSPEGTFDSFSQEEEIGKSIYELHTDDGVHGTFELLQSPDALATAMISVSQFLKPVCRITGNTHRMPDRIDTVEPGEAQCKDGIWTVTKKTVVEFR